MLELQYSLSKKAQITKRTCGTSSRCESWFRTLPGFRVTLAAMSSFLSDLGKFTPTTPCLPFKVKHSVSHRDYFTLCEAYQTAVGLMVGHAILQIDVYGSSSIAMMSLSKTCNTSDVLYFASTDRAAEYWCFLRSMLGYHKHTDYRRGKILGCTFFCSLINKEHSQIMEHCACRD